MTPPPLKRKFPWIIVLVVSFGLLAAAPVALLGLMFSWNRFSGKGEWARVKKDLLDRGEKLTLVELAPPPVPDEANFFADPLWVELHPGGTGANPGEAGVPKGRRQLDVLQRPATDPHFQELMANYPEFSFTGSTVHQSLLKLASKEKESDLRRRRRAAEFTLAAMKESEPVLKRVEELAPRPESAFPVDYEAGLKMELPHIPYVLVLGQALKMRASAEMSLGDREAAHRDILTLQRLTRVLAKEPTLIFPLVRLNLENMALLAMAEGAKAHIWTEDELAEFERILAPVDFVPDLVLALRGERGCFNQTAEDLRKSTRRRQFPGSSVSPADRVLSLSHDQAFANRLIQEWIDEIKKAPEQGLTSRSMSDTELEALKKNPLRKIRNILSSLFLSSLPGASRKFAWTQDQVRLTRVACALERYRLRDGDYPDDLAVLVPEFLPALPVDIVTLGPVHYRKDEKEGFLLWTPGWDEKDDGGKPADRETNEGDWVWGKSL